MTDFQWWCVAQNEPWEWSWQPYPGVWIVVAAVAFAYVRLLRAVRRSAEAETDAASGGVAAGAVERWRIGAFVTGLVILWAGLDWPLGALGASYLASVHMIQYLLVGILVPALLLLGIPPGAFEPLRERAMLFGAIRSATHPIVALVVFNVGMTVTHWPEVVDVLRASQLGSFGLDFAWMSFGLIFWWPLTAPVPGRPGFHPLLQVAYLAANVVFIMPPVAMMLFSESPIYATYELAPPVGTLEPLWDQQSAGAIMKVGSAWIMAAAMLVVAYRWYLDAREDPTGALG